MINLGNEYFNKCTKSFVNITKDCYYNYKFERLICKLRRTQFTPLKCELHHAYRCFFSKARFGAHSLSSDSDKDVDKLAQMFETICPSFR